MERLDTTLTFLVIELDSIASIFRWPTEKLLVLIQWITNIIDTKEATLWKFQVLVVWLNLARNIVGVWMGVQCLTLCCYERGCFISPSHQDNQTNQRGVGCVAVFS